MSSDKKTHCAPGSGNELFEQRKWENDLLQMALSQGLGFLSTPTLPILEDCKLDRIFALLFFNID